MQRFADSCVEIIAPRPSFRTLRDSLSSRSSPSLRSNHRRCSQISRDAKLTCFGQVSNVNVTVRAGFSRAWETCDDVIQRLTAAAADEPRSPGQRVTPMTSNESMTQVGCWCCLAWPATLWTAAHRRRRQDNTMYGTSHDRLRRSLNLLNVSTHRIVVSAVRRRFPVGLLSVCH